MDYPESKLLLLAHAFENLGAGDDRRAVLTVYYTAGEAAGDRRP